jgi:hypothetical protein
MTTALVHLGFLVVVSAEKARILNRQYIMSEGKEIFNDREWILFIGVESGHV